MSYAIVLKITFKDGTISEKIFNSKDSKTIKIGRSPSCQVLINDPKVSRIHAVIELADTEATLVDMGSAGGIYLNGQKTSKSLLRSGDTVKISSAQIEIRTLHDAEQKNQKNVQVEKKISTTPKKSSDADLSKLKEKKEKVTKAPIAYQQAFAGVLEEKTLDEDNKLLELRFFSGEALLGIYHYQYPKKITVGESDKANLFISTEGLGADLFPVIECESKNYYLCFSKEMKGEVENKEKTYSLDNLTTEGLAVRDDKSIPMYRFPFSLGMKAVLHWGGASMAMRFVAPIQLVKVPFYKSIDIQYVNSLITSLFAHLMFLVTLLLYPLDTDALKVDIFSQPDRFANLLLEAPKETKSTKETLDKIKQQVKENTEKIKPQPVTEKQATSSTLSSSNKGLKAKTNTPAPTAEQKKAEITQKFGQLFKSKENLVGGGGGGQLSGALQGVIGTTGQGSTAGGLKGLGIRSTGALSGGAGVSQGIGGIGTSGRVGGGGLGYGSGVGLGQHGEASGLILETPRIEGSLSSEVIKKVINDNRNQIRYCYEKELQHNQSLQGRIVMRWIIGSNGEVVFAAVKESTMKNDQVEACLIEKIKRWKFPSPAGGGTVEVNYPFVFKAN